MRGFILEIVYSLTMWVWSDHFQPADLKSRRVVENLAGQFVDLSSTEFELDVPKCRAAGLSVLPLFEWGLDGRVIFAELAKVGSTKGYYISTYMDESDQRFICEVPIDQPTAEIVEANSLLEGGSGLFFDDQCLCAVSWHWSDEAYWGMRRDMFERIIAAEPFDLTLLTENPHPPAHDFDSALAGAIRRYREWQEFQKRPSDENFIRTFEAQ